jgi:hypothetical protein
MVHMPVGLLHKRHEGVRCRGAGALGARAEVGGVPGGESRPLQEGVPPPPPGRTTATSPTTMPRVVANRTLPRVPKGTRPGGASTDWLNGGGHAVAESGPTPSLLEDIVACRGGSRNAGTHESVVWVYAQKGGATFASHWPLCVWVPGQDQPEAGARGEVVVAEREGRTRPRGAQPC